MVEPQATAVPGLDGAWTMSLTHGGDLSITEHDGQYTLHLTKDGTSYTRLLSALDVWEFRQMSNTIVAGRLQEATP